MVAGVQEPLGDWAAETLRRHWREGQSSGFFLLGSPDRVRPGVSGRWALDRDLPWRLSCGQGHGGSVFKGQSHPRLGPHGRHGSRFLPSLEHCPALRPAEPCLVDTAGPRGCGQGKCRDLGSGAMGHQL